MIRIAGGAVLILCAALWGNEHSAVLKSRRQLTAALAEFVRFAGERIEDFSDPLGVIFSSFSNETLEKIGFLKILREEGVAAAADSVSARLLADDSALFREFADKIGSGYRETQAALCSYIAGRLRESELRQAEQLPDKLKMYRLLPVLAAMSAVILII